MWRSVIIIPVVAFISLANPPVPFAALSSPPNHTSAEKSLVVTGSILSKRCLAWNKNLAELRIRLQFTNSLSRPLILNKPDLEIITIKYFAFIDEKKAQAHLGELAVDRLRGYVPEYDRMIAGARPNSQFVILAPRHSYVMETTESVPLITAAPEFIPATNRPDDYQIEVELATWVNYAPRIANSLRRRWRRIGMLWSKTIWSEPIGFTFPRSRSCET